MEQTAWPWLKGLRVKGEKESGQVVMAGGMHISDFSSSKFDMEVFSVAPKWLGDMVSFLFYSYES